MSAISEQPCALLFPGQGSQTPTMRELVAAHSPDLLELTLEKVGADPFERIEQTRYAQPALLCASIAGWERAGRPRAAVYAGHSLGELAALVAAGSIDPADGVWLATRRGELMEEAARSAPPGGMLALLGDGDAARSIAEAAAVTLANDNAPGQLVVSGPLEALDAAASGASAAGLKTITLPVGGAFHSPAMAPAVPRFRAVLDEIEVKPADGLVFSAAGVRPFEDVRAQLAEALIKPVRWRETLEAIHRRGIERFFDVGPGKVLCGMARRTLDGIEAKTLDAVVDHA